MSYIDDFNENVNNKIPYDDIPISRNVRKSRSVRSSSRGASVSSFKILVAIVSVLFIANIILCSTMFYYLKNGKVKNVNVYYNEINATEESISTVASNKALKSAVCIAAGGSCSDEYSFYNYTLSKGAGVIYDVDENTKTVYFVTCFHVVDGYNKNEIWVLLPSKLVPIKAKLVSYSSHYDIAVLKYTYSESSKDLFLDGCMEISTSDSTYLSLGEKVFAVGNPLSNGFSITEGTISRLNTLMTVESNSFKTREIQISAAINKGNSGGGLFNAEGKFIGLVNSKITSNGVEGTAYAIPGNLVMGVAGSIIRNNTGTTKHNGYASYIELGATLEHNENMGVTFEEVEYAGKKVSIMKYYVVVDDIDGGIAVGKLGSKDLIETIEFSMYDRGEIVTKKVEMFNRFVFEDYCYSIVENSQITFYIKENGVGETKQIVVNASAINIID